MISLFMRPFPTASGNMSYRQQAATNWVSDGLAFRTWHAMASYPDLEAARPISFQLASSLLGHSNTGQKPGYFKSDTPLEASSWQLGTSIRALFSTLCGPGLMRTVSALCSIKAGY